MFYLRFDTRFKLRKDFIDDGYEHYKSLYSGGEYNKIRCL